MKTVQVLLAVYNGETFIEEQIASIMQQSYSDLHLIVRDNSSTDKTVAVVEKLSSVYPNRISLLRSKVNEGVIGNFAKLAEASTSPYVMFADADDVWHQDKVLKSFNKIKEMEGKYGSSAPLLVHTDLAVVNRNLENIHPSFWQYSCLDPLKGCSLNRQLIQNAITGCTTLLNRRLLDLALPFPDCIVMHDWWLGLVATSLGKVDCISEPTILYRQHGNNDTGAKKYGLRSFFQRYLNKKEKDKIRTNIEKKYAQAMALKLRHKDRLTVDQLDMLEDFVAMKEFSFFKKRCLMIKHGFYKQGILRNILEFLPIEWLFHR